MADTGFVINNADSGNIDKDAVQVWDSSGTLVNTNAAELGFVAYDNVDLARKFVLYSNLSTNGYTGAVGTNCNLMDTNGNDIGPNFVKYGTITLLSPMLINGTYIVDNVLTGRLYTFTSNSSVKFINTSVPFSFLLVGPGGNGGMKYTIRNYFDFNFFDSYTLFGGGGGAGGCIDKSYLSSNNSFLRITLTTNESKLENDTETFVCGRGGNGGNPIIMDNIDKDPDYVPETNQNYTDFLNIIYNNKPGNGENGVNFGCGGGGGQSFNNNSYFSLNNINTNAYISNKNSIITTPTKSFGGTGKTNGGDGLFRSSNYNTGGGGGGYSLNGNSNGTGGTGISVTFGNKIINVCTGGNSTIDSRIKDFGDGGDAGDTGKPGACYLFVKNFNPTSVSGCKLWLDGADPSTIFSNTFGTILAKNGELVKCWKNKAVNNTNNIVWTNAGPTYTPSTGSIYFNSTKSDNNINIVNITDFFIVASYTGGIVSTAGLLSNGPTNSSFYTNTVLLGGTPAHNNGVVNSFRIVSAWGYLYVNGENKDAVANWNNLNILSLNGINNKTLTNGFIGYNGYSGGNWVGNINEIICFDAALNQVDRQKIEGYLAWKWSINSKLSSSHPHFKNPPL